MDASKADEARLARARLTSAETIANERSVPQSIHHLVDRVTGSATTPATFRKRFFIVVLLLLQPLAFYVIVMGTGGRAGAGGGGGEASGDTAGFRARASVVANVANVAHVLWYIGDLGYRVWFTAAVAAALWAMPPAWLSAPSFVVVSLVTAGVRAVLDDAGMRAFATLAVFGTLTTLFVVGTPLVVRILWFHPWALRARHALVRRLTQTRR